MGTAQVCRAVAAWLRIPHRLWGLLGFAGLWPCGFESDPSHRDKYASVLQREVSITPHEERDHRRRENDRGEVRKIILNSNLRVEVRMV